MGLIIDPKQKRGTLMPHKILQMSYNILTPYYVSSSIPKAFLTFPVPVALEFLLYSEKSLPE